VLRATERIRNRDAAALLGVSEGELIASSVGDTAIRLAGDFRELLRGLEPVGRVMALTRNDACVHEKDGVYTNLSWERHVGLALGEEIDLRLFFSHWRHGFAVADETPRGVLRSLQFYDAAGQAVHKIYLRKHSVLTAYAALVEAFRAPDQSASIDATPLTPKAPARPDSAIDVRGFRAAWAGMRDTHEFFGLLKRYGVTRVQGLRLTEPRFAQPAPISAARALLAQVATTGTPIMVFVGNPGCIQIHSGPVANVKALDRWLNVLGSGFNLHLREDLIVSAWVVRKPTADGIVTSLELFDAAGDMIAMFFGKRKPGVPEIADWRDTVAKLFPPAP
jgi:putative hemin transport protein